MAASHEFPTAHATAKRTPYSMELSDLAKLALVAERDTVQ